ncbi:hypothetical protein AB0K60_31450 [Thermopolyspora sp. NPDC052614]|uniref:hypothetical protein n=1 Tax=Thermopolyspora sp. NPDC052614 TaxID=3155682 RepID=UPI00341E2097
MSDSVRPPSVWSLPWRTVRLAGRCVLPLLVWFSFGELVRFGLLVGGTELSHGSFPQLRYALTVPVFIVMVLISLIVVIGMLYSLRGELTEMRARRAEGGDEDFLGGLSRAIIPYVALYLAWGWHIDDVREFAEIDIERQSGDLGYLGAWADFATGKSQGTATGLIGLTFTNALIIMAAAFVLRFVFLTWHDRRGSKVAALATAFCELTFFYYGVQVVVGRQAWLDERVIITWWNDAKQTAAANVPGWQAVTDFLGEVWPFVWDALVLPGAWLTVAILVYGAYSEDMRTAITGTRLETGVTRAEEALARRTHALTRQGLSRFFGRWAHWMALANTVRLTVRGGAPLFGLFLVCFAAIQIAEGYLWRGMVYLIGGDHPLLYWNVLFVPMEFVRDFIITVLTVCLFAATFDLAATRGRALAPGRAGRGAASDTDAPASGSPAAATARPQSAESAASAARR